jgi:hypothetical protein
VFDEVSVDNSVLDFGVYYNYTISYGRDIVGAMSLITQAFASLLPSPRIVANFGTSPLCGAQCACGGACARACVLTSRFRL